MRLACAYILLSVLAACTPNKQPGYAPVVIEDGKNYFGKKINEHKSVGLQEFDILANNTDTLFIKLKAGISEVCLEDGCWFRINLYNGERMIVTFENEAFVIPTDVAGKHVLIEGKTYLETMSEDDMKKLAVQAGEIQWVIDTIRGPHIQRTFVAKGAVIVQ
jgi:hypothetical protein